MKLKIDWKKLGKQLWEAVKPVLLAAIGGGIVSVAAGCSALQTPQTKTQTSAIYALGLPAVVITHGASQAADYSGDDSNAATQVSEPETKTTALPINAAP